MKVQLASVFGSVDTIVRAPQDAFQPWHHKFIFLSFRITLYFGCPLASTPWKWQGVARLLLEHPIEVIMLSTREFFQLSFEGQDLTCAWNVIG